MFWLCTSCQSFVIIIFGRPRSLSKASVYSPQTLCSFCFGSSKSRCISSMMNFASSFSSCLYSHELVSHPTSILFFLFSSVVVISTIVLSSTSLLEPSLSVLGQVFVFSFTAATDVKLCCDLFFFTSFSVMHGPMRHGSFVHRGIQKSFLGNKSPKGFSGDTKVFFCDTSLFWV